jgi:hypothetical protein
VFPNVGRIKQNGRFLADQQQLLKKEYCKFSPGVIIIDLPVLGAGRVEHILGVNISARTYTNEKRPSSLVFNLLRHGQKSLFYIPGVLCRCLEEGDASFVSKFLGDHRRQTPVK